MANGQMVSFMSSSFSHIKTAPGAHGIGNWMSPIAGLDVTKGNPARINTLAIAIHSLH